LYFVLRGFANPGYWRSLPQRFGFLSHSFRQTGPGAIWLHAVSVGEVISCVEFLRALQREFPRTRIFVSTSTLAGQALAREKLAGLAHGVFYAPVDTVWAVRRAIRAIRPSLVIIAETEIWPNLFREVKRTGAALAIVNGRISDRALPRYRALRWFFQGVLPQLDCVLAQSDSTRSRFVELGASSERVLSTGNLKYDSTPNPAPPDSPVRALLHRITPTRVWIAASTMPPLLPGDPDEDDSVIDSFRKLAALHPGLLLILVPRHPERFDAAARKLESAGIRYLRRSRLNAHEALDLPGVLLLDSIGELSGLFAVADVVFMGGTLASRGGHNVLEPALFAKPVIVGPHLENFQPIADEFRAAGAFFEISSPAGLTEAMERLLEHSSQAGELGRRALACAEGRRGATARAVAVVRQLYAARVPCYRPAQPWFASGWLPARIWVWIAQHRRQRAEANCRRLPVPVISIGNLTMGGTGKTPCVLQLAALFQQRGRAPGILTRGYGRASPDKELIVPPGASIGAQWTGDEPQLFIRSGLAPVGIGGDRFATGRALLREFPANVLLLDDGFQHVRLARAVDIVLLDALNPFGGGSVFPLGRLREPMTGLARADLVLITRSELSDLGCAVEREVRRWNPLAPIFRAHLEAKAWVDHRSGRHWPLSEAPLGPVAGFCGLGNPQSFRRTLERQRLRVVDWLEFHDHHRYRPYELRHMAAQFQAKGAAALVTTEKDVVNLCEGSHDLLAPLSLYYLATTLVIERQEEFLREIERRMQ
jgi:3-deoxy-D-manno-octulosonic-acid transferase